MYRRSALGVVTGVALAGCLSGSDDGSNASGDEGGGDETHPALRGIDDRPQFGPPPAEAAATIVTFDDPACPRCADFHDGAFAQLRDEDAADGRLTLVARVFPVIADWSETGSAALLGTYDRDPDAYESLLAHYYETQSSITAENVIDHTRTFLDEETDLDGDDLVGAVEAGEYDDAVQQDHQAGEDAGASSTPTAVLFADGEHVTNVAGNQNVAVYRDSLGL